jgi:hypothetical protein
MDVNGSIGRLGILILSLLLLCIDRIDSNLLVIFLERRKILTSLGELPFLHTLANVPVHEGTLGVEQVKLVVETGPSSGNAAGMSTDISRQVGLNSRRSIGQHADGSRDLGQVSARDQCGRLVTNTELNDQLGHTVKRTLNPVGHQSTN